MATEKAGDSGHAYTERRDDAPYPNTGEPANDMSTGRYLATRISSLRPPMDKVENPITVLRLLNAKQWLFFLCSFIAWTWDAYVTPLSIPCQMKLTRICRFDFFTVSLTVTDLAETFDRSKADITWGITLVLMFRSVGAIIFGIAADRYGR